ncbi:uncharacterized protein LOC108239990 [Kryptolebias marmoratus]|uniref:uncharacterized protein LOC108239990 n=1 Tax=Kryptolebias marmoratus TaxID=37003 RepID=UPI0018ACBB10|nr:uncharacterized protein LOC108239990 [Kryptolebias marmoratus]
MIKLTTRLKIKVQPSKELQHLQLIRPSHNHLQFQSNGCCCRWILWTLMALSFGVSWLCVLLWGSVCFAPEPGYNIAHGYYLYKSPQTSAQLTPGEYLNPNYENETNALRERTFVSPRRDPVSFGNEQRLIPVRSFSEETEQSQPDFIKKRAAVSVSHTDNSKSKVRSRRGNDHRIPDRHQSLNNLIGSNFISTGLRGNQVFSRQPARHPYRHFTALELATNKIPNVGIPSGRNGLFISGAKNKHLPMTYKQPQQIWFPSGLFLNQDSFTVRKTGPPIDASSRPSRDFAYFSQKTSRSIPLPFKKSVKKTKYVYPRNVFQAGYKTPLGGFDSKGLRKATKAGPLQKPPSLNYFVPRNQIYVPNYEAEHRKKAAKSILTYQSSTGKKSNNDYYTPAVQRSASVESVSYLHDLSPLKGGQKYFQANVPYKSQKELDESNLVFNVKPSPHGLSRLSSSLGPQKVDVDPFRPSTRSENTRKSHLYHQNLASALQNADVKYSGMKSTQNSVSSQDRFLLQNGGYEDAVQAGLLKIFNQPVFSDGLKKEPANFAPWSSEASEPKGSGLNCVVWKNTQSSPLQKSQKSSWPSVKRYVKSGNRSAGATEFLSKTCYFPFQRAQDMAANLQQKQRWQR